MCPVTHDYHTFQPQIAQNLLHKNTRKEKQEQKIGKQIVNTGGPTIPTT